VVSIDNLLSRMTSLTGCRNTFLLLIKKYRVVDAQPKGIAERERERLWFRYAPGRGMESETAADTVGPRAERGSTPSHVTRRR
jgi:hypothetical protein